MASFWTTQQSPQIDSLLLQEDLTLHELLDYDGILQELKGQNKKLIEFLLRPEILDELVTIITTDPSLESNETEGEYKYAIIACELLTSDLPPMNERLSEENILDKFYNFLKTSSFLNPLLASYCSRVLTLLISPKTGEQNWYSYQLTCLRTLQYIGGKDDFGEILIRHLGTSAITDLTFNLLTSIEGPELKQTSRDWIFSKNIISSLISLLSPIVDPDRQSNASQVITDIITKLRYMQENNEPDPILISLESTKMVTLLLNTILNVEQISETSLSAGITVLLAIFQPFFPADPPCRRILTHSVHGESNNSSLKLSPDISPTSVDENEVISRINNLLNGVAPFMAHLHNVLADPPKKLPIKLSSGIIDPPLGIVRWLIIKLITNLIGLNSTEIIQSLMDLGTIQLILDLFFEYSLNNFLHIEVEKLVAYAVDRSQFYNPIPDSAVMAHLINECRLLERILKALDDNKKLQDNGEPRRGYMGHLYKIASMIYMEERNNFALKDLLSMATSDACLEKWNCFTESCLQLVIQLHSTPLGGVPSSLVTKNNCYDESTSSLEVANWASTGQRVNHLKGLGQDSNDDFNMSDVMEGDNVMNEDRSKEVFDSICAQKWKSFNQNLNNLDGDLEWSDSSNHITSWSDDEDEDYEIKEFDDLQNNNSNIEKNPWEKIGAITNPWSSNNFENGSSDCSSNNWATFEDNISDSFDLGGESNDSNITSSFPSDIFSSADQSVSFTNQFGTIGEKSDRKNKILDDFSSIKVSDNGDSKMDLENCENVCGSLFPTSGVTIFNSEQLMNGMKIIRENPSNNNMKESICGHNENSNFDDNEEIDLKNSKTENDDWGNEKNLLVVEGELKLMNGCLKEHEIDSEDSFSKTDSSSLTSPESDKGFADIQNIDNDDVIVPPVSESIQIDDKIEICVSAKNDSLETNNEQNLMIEEKISIAEDVIRNSSISENYDDLKIGNPAFALKECKEMNLETDKTAESSREPP